MKPLYLHCIKQVILLRTFIVFFIFLFFSQTVLYAQIINGNFSFEGINRKYFVFLPKNFSSDIQVPLVIDLHAYGDTAGTEMNYTRMTEVADTAGFIVAYPSGLPNWNSGLGDNPSWPTSNADDVGFISALIDTLSNRYNIDLKKVYACGYSNGGFMAHKLACQLSRRIAAIASVGGVMSVGTKDNAAPVRKMKILQIHGTADVFVPMEGETGWLSVNQTLAYWTDFNNCPLDQAQKTTLPDLDPSDGCLVEKTTYQNCANNNNVIYYKVINGGHTWPGADPPGYNAGLTTHDFNASTEIWKFFNNKYITSVEKLIEEGKSKDHLLGIYPNPFHLKTSIAYQLPTESKVEIRIYNIFGQEIKTFLFQNTQAGEHKVTWDRTNNIGKQITNGIYFINLSALNFKKTIKIIIY